MINAINSNLISLLWAQAESIVPTLWLCTSLCWFFILPLFICLYHGLQDFQCRWHGVDVQTKLAERAETWPVWTWIQGEFEAIPILPVSCSFIFQHFCTKDIKYDAHLSYFQFLLKYILYFFSSYHRSAMITWNRSTQRSRRGEGWSVQTGSNFSKYL